MRSKKAKTDFSTRPRVGDDEALNRGCAAWKAAERAVARLLGGRRCHFECQDVDAGTWAVEVKHGRQIPRALLRWWEQTRRNTPDGKRPLLVLHPHGADYQEFLAVMRLGDLTEYGHET